MNLDLWQIYGSREDTDAAVIRELERRVQDAERMASDARSRYDKIVAAVNSAGFRFRDGGYDKPPRLEPLEDSANG